MKRNELFRKDLSLAVGALILIGFLSSPREAAPAEVGYIDTHNHAPVFPQSPTCA